MTGPPPTRSAPVSIRWWLFGGWLALLAVHMWIAWGVTGPIVLQDESGYLGNARWLVGASPVSEMGEQPMYGWGYSVVIAPLVALIDDPALLYRAVQVVNALLLASLLPLLWLVLRRIGGIEPGAAAVAALAGSVFPATLVHSSVALAESLLPVIVVLLVLAIWWALTERPAWQRVLVAPISVAAYATHPRMLPALGLVIVGLLAAGAARRMPRGVAIVGVALAVVGVVAVRLINAAVVDARWSDQVTRAGSETRLLTRLFNPMNWPALVGGAIGQGWYVAATSLGLGAAGTIALAAWIGKRPASDPARLATACSAIVVLALFVTSAVSFVGTAVRVDHLIYGRYNEAFIPLLVAAGAAALVTLDGPQRRSLAAVSAAATAAMGLALVVGRGGPGAFTGDLVWNNVLGMRPAMEIVGSRWMVPMATVTALLAMGVVWVVARRPRLSIAALSAALVVSGAVAVGPLTAFSETRYDGWELPEHLTRVLEFADIDEVALDSEGTGLPGALAYQYWLPTTDFSFVDIPDVEVPELLVSRVDADIDSSIDASRDARIALLDARNRQAVWAMPGTAVFDRLAARGALLPQGFPAELPDAAQQARIELAEGQASALEVRAGDTIEVTVKVEHAGSDAQWPSDAEWPDFGVVRLGARWSGPAGAEARNVGRGTLPHPMWPGDEINTTIMLSATDVDGSPLAPGSYEVALDMVQEGFTWFDSRDVPRLTVVVTPD